MKKITLFLLTVLILYGLNGFSQSIITFEFSSLAGNEVSALSNSNDVNLNTSTITRGSGLTASSNSGRFNATSWALTSIANAVTGNDYMEFTITPKSGFQFNITSIYIQMQRSSTGPRGIAIRSSVDNYATNLDQEYAISDITSTQNFTFTFSQANSTSPVTYRIYMWAESTSGSGGIGDGSGDDIIVYGTTSSTGGIVDPSSFTATTASPSQIDLSWALNGNSNNVMVAYNTSNTFGTPTNGNTYSASDAISGGGTVIYNGSSTSFNHTSLSSDTHYYYKAWSVDGSTNYSSGVTTDATTYKTEPSNQATSFSAGTPTATTIPLTWSDNDGSTIADGYVIKMNTTGTFTNPVDGTAVVDNSDSVNVTHGTQAYTFTNLNPSTTYYFKIWAYTNSGSAIDYKTDGTVPTANAATTAYSGPNAWINEFHYDNIGTDVGEFVEIVIENAGSYTLSDFQVDLYNGSGGASYDSQTVDNFTVGNTVGNYTFYYWTPSTLQNGPDGIALSYQGTFIPGQFLSYGGSFAATDGPANGATSTDIGVAESSSTIGYSLQLTDGGSQYSDFSWQEPALATAGAVNNGQTFGSSTSAGLWTGATSTAWNTAANWDDGSVPSSATNVYIPSGVTNYPVVGVSTSANCNNLVINSSASLTLASDATGNGSLIVNGTPTGSVSVQRYIAGYAPGNEWHLLSSPVNNMAISGSDFDPGTADPNLDDLFAWGESTYTWLNYKVAGNNITNFTNGQGYLIAYQTTATKSFSGTPNNSDIPLSDLSLTDGVGYGWHLLGNPFTSALTWGDANWSLTNVSGTAKLWNASAGTFTDITSGGIIPATNGFFVQVSSATNSLTIPTADQIHDAANNFKASAVQQETLKFKITNDANTYYDENTFGFKSDATDNYDFAFDSHKLFSMVSTAPQLWTVVNDENYSTNFMTAPGENKTIPLNFKPGVNSTYHLSWTGMDNMDTNLEFLLEDKQTSQSINMKDYSQYDFTATTDDSNDRFVLHINSANGIQQNSIDEYALVYSVKKDVYIKAKNNQVLNGEVILHNLLGQVVYRSKLNGTSQQTLRTQLNTGVYIVRMEMNDGTVLAKKVVIR